MLDVGGYKENGLIHVKNTHTRLCNILRKRLQMYAGNPAGICSESYADHSRSQDPVARNTVKSNIRTTTLYVCKIFAEECRTFKQ